MGRMVTALIDINDDDETFKEKNYLPTLAFMKSSNIEAWGKIKDIVIDIGFKYTKRINLFTSIMFLVSILYAIAMLLFYFKIFDVYISTESWVMGIIDILSVASIIMVVIRLGAMINSSWNKEIGILLDIKHEIYKVVKNEHTMVNK